MKRLVRSLVLSGVVATAFLACTFTRSLDYLTNGGDDAGGSGTETGVVGDGNAQIPEGGGLPGNAETIAAAQFNPRNLAQDSANLYWSSNDAIMSKAKAGGGDAKKIASAGAGKVISWLTADANASGGLLYVIVNGEVHSVPKAGGDLTLIEKEAPKANLVVADGTTIFVAHADEATALGHVLRFGPNGSARALLSPEDWNPHGMAVVGPSLFVAGEEPIDILGVVYQLPTNAMPTGDGGTTPSPTVYKGAGATDIYPDGPALFAVDEEAIYWFDSLYATPSSVFRVARASPSSTPTTVFAAPEGTKITHLVLDKDHVYLTDERAGGSVIKLTKSGAAPPAGIATNQPVPTGVLVDDRYVYFTTQGTALAADGAVVRVPK